MRNTPILNDRAQHKKQSVNYTYISRLQLRRNEIVKHHQDTHIQRKPNYLISSNRTDHRINQEVPLKDFLQDSELTRIYFFHINNFYNTCLEPSTL